MPDRTTILVEVERQVRAQRALRATLLADDARRRAFADRVRSVMAEDAKIRAFMQAAVVDHARITRIVAGVRPVRFPFRMAS